MRVRVEPVMYKHTNDRGRWTSSRAYAIVDPAGKPVYVGLFATEEKASDYIRQRGWKQVQEAA